MNSDKYRQNQMFLHDYGRELDTLRRNDAEYTQNRKQHISHDTCIAIRPNVRQI